MVKNLMKVEFSMVISSILFTKTILRANLVYEVVSVWQHQKLSKEI